MEELVSQLNDSQREAVLYTDGPELVIAGAGSGKTRVLTYKIAYLLQQGMAPYHILALTFTNKAAREMKERIVTLTDPSKARRLWMGTFHAVFSRILRTEAERIGYTSNFTIYDSADSKSLLKSIIKEMKLDDKMYRPGMVQTRISKAKNALVTSKMYEQNKELVQGDINARLPMIRDIYRLYQIRCFQAGAMDFDDLLLQTNILFRDHPDVLAKYRSHFQYILVDEYQDTNQAQHLIVQQLSEEHRRVCVVGDDAQSIYSFRGANIDNVLQLKNVYPDLRIFKLEQNYRSTQNIVDAANSLIRKNKEQIPKTVYSEKEKGSKVFLASSYSDYEEAYIVASKIEEQRREGRYSFADFAVLYRTNAQSRILEEALRRRNIPYKIYGGLSFYQRKEIKDVIAYLRLIINPHDEEALKRIINYPTRGIGDTTVGKLLVAASENTVSVWTVLEHPEAYSVPLNSGTLKKLVAFREMIEGFIGRNEALQADEITSVVIKESGMAGELFQDRSVEGISRQENIDELLKGISEYIDIRLEEGMEQVALADFLSEVSLLTDQDNDKEENANKVTLMTIHAAKGLEFKNVIVVGLEEDLFPSLMSKDNQRAIEEERRLFYVAITRAEENCTLTYAKSRFRNGQSNLCSPSRFLRDIDAKYLHAPGEPTRQPAFTSSFQQPKAVAPQTVEPKPPVASPQQQPDVPEDTSGLKVGMKVRHDRFGTGEITALEGSGGNTKATVYFSNFGQKQLLLKFARLTIIK
ncbi:MAG: UvrD-helicase domain-containing protein [Tannerellaceae bacterium]|jgi:DNA helicase-2/ATP-dependent DNA helicase PcrA|nr:UvrD-helicase domain-containing protein [Tannerellaceae bacterium]